MAYTTFILIFCIACIAEAREFHQQRRLTANSYGARPQQQTTPAGVFPKFANQGGPPDTRGVWYNDQYIGMDTPSGFVSTVYLGDGNFMQQMGRFESWECLGKGKYRAVVMRRDIFSNGTIITARHCEVGHVDLSKGTYGYASSESSCPPADVPLRYNTNVKSPTQPRQKEYTCKAKGLPRHLDTRGVSGLDPASVPGTVASGGPLPPPIEAGDFPPSYNNSGGPEITDGIWYSAASKTAELVSKGSFSSVALQEDGTFIQVLGKVTSYDCSGAASYTGAASFALSQQNDARITGDGCTIGAVDTNSKPNIYTWQPVDATQCPTPDPIKDTVMKRVTNSKMIPTTTQLTCKA